MQYLAILRVRPGTPKEVLMPLAKPEAAKAWEFISTGAVRSIHYIPGPGAVLMLEAKDQPEAEALIGELPIVKEDIVTTEILALTPFTGFAALFAA